MTIKEFKNSFEQGKVGKPEFIEQMYKAYHSTLFDYQNYMSSTDIESITINSEGVVFESKKFGVKMWGLPGDYRMAPVEILNFGQYEPEETEMMLKVLPEGATIYDIGANGGWFSLLFSLHDKKSKIYCFEPIPSTYQLLIRNIALNSARNIYPNNFGLSDKKDIVEFYYSRHGSGNASIENVSENLDAEKVTARIEVLDDVFESNDGVIDFIKCDVEGAELLVYRGGMNAISHCKPIIFSEILRKWSAKYGYHPNDIIELFSGMGYGCFVCGCGGLKQFELVNDDTIETNYFFLHYEKHAELISELVGLE